MRIATTFILIAVLAWTASSRAAPGSVATFTISGQVTDGFGHAVSGATVALSGAQSSTTISDANGNYAFSNLPSGNYQLSASIPGRHDTITFAVAVNNLSSDTTKNLQVLFFVTFQIWVKDASGVGLADVSIDINQQSGVFAAKTNSFGLANIGITVPMTGDGPPVTFTPEKPGYVFNPSSLTLSTQNGGQVVNFTGTPTGLPISFIQFSSIVYTVGEGDGSVTITVTRAGDTSTAVTADYFTVDTASANQKSDYIMAAGTLKFAAGETAKTFSVLIIDNAYPEGNHSFGVQLNNPTGGASLGNLRAASVNIIDNDTGPATGNPIDDPSFFAREQYYDFLNRYPDLSGWNFWSNQISSCSGDASCIDNKRINVSAAFFLSIEFQQTGYLVERVYKAAYGNLPGAPVPIRFSEFLPDTQLIGQGIVVGQTGWDQALETNKQNFMSSFVQRSRFTSAYPTSMGAQQFVDALYTNAGLVPTSAPNRSQAISEFNSTTPSDPAARARALRDVAEDPMLTQQEFNRAFVLMQYFGYLRRNPNDAPDSDFSGYNFWLGKLNQFGGNYQAAEMVKAFIVSNEYRQRFGP